MDVITVLGDVDVDVLELALSVPGLEVTAGGSARFADSEGTPVAAFEDGRLSPLQPFAPRPGIDAPHRADAAAAVVFDALPTRAQVAAVEAISVDGPIAWVALTGRARSGPRAAALLGAVAAAAEAWAARTGRPAPVAALPWSLDERPESLQAPQLASPEAFTAWLPEALGVAEVVVFGEGEEHRGLATLEEGAAGAARALFAAEVLPFHRGERGAGTVVFFTGLSGSGKSTVANAVAARLTGDGETVSVLDGDTVRQLLSAGLGFDAESRALNVRRIGWVAAQIARAGGVAVAAPIAPFAAGRAEARRTAHAAGARFVLVHVATPLEVCERRDRKGHYAAARAGRLPDFTGISSPYEEPDDADVTLDTAESTVDEAVEAVLKAMRA